MQDGLQAVAVGHGAFGDAIEGWRVRRRERAAERVGKRVLGKGAGEADVDMPLERIAGNEVYRSFQIIYRAIGIA